MLKLNTQCKTTIVFSVLKFYETCPFLFYSFKSFFTIFNVAFAFTIVSNLFCLGNEEGSVLNVLNFDCFLLFKNQIWKILEKNEFA